MENFLLISFAVNHHNLDSVYVKGEIHYSLGNGCSSVSLTPDLGRYASPGPKHPCLCLTLVSRIVPTLCTCGATQVDTGPWY